MAIRELVTFPSLGPIIHQPACRDHRCDYWHPALGQCGCSWSGHSALHSAPFDHGAAREYQHDGVLCVEWQRRRSDGAIAADNGMCPFG
jgi:hypothetical protein